MRLLLFGLLGVFPACLVVILRRRGRRAKGIVPFALALYTLYCGTGLIVGLIHSFSGVAGVDPSMKATLLARGISETMNCGALLLVLSVPLLVGSRIVDRWVAPPPP
jgi:hypothetical protein